MSFRRTAALCTLLVATACAERGEEGPPTAPATPAPPDEGPGTVLWFSWVDEGAEP